MYKKQGFYSGQRLKASQLDAMEGAAGAANMEKGTGASATQQLPDKVADGFDFTGKNANATALDPSLTGIIPYGATGDFANAFGGKCAAQGKRSTAKGTTTIAKGKYSSAEGDNSVALGDDSHAEGFSTVSKGVASHSEGHMTQALGDRSHTEGNNTIATGDSSHAAGDRTQAKGVASYAGGAVTVAGHDYQTVVGIFNDNQADTLFEVGGGSSSSNRKNLFSVHKDGTLKAGDKIIATTQHVEEVATKAVTELPIKQKPGYQGSAILGGENLNITNNYQVVVGRCNLGRSNTVFEVGTGFYNYKNNGFEVYANGDIGIRCLNNDKVYSLYDILTQLNVNWNALTPIDEK